MTYVVSVVPMDPLPVDEGITLRIELPATSARQAERRALRYVRSGVVTEIRRVRGS